MSQASVIATTAPPRQTAGHAPLRKPSSIRRTSSIDVSWPEGRMADMRFDGRARDIFTEADGKAYRLLAEDGYVATIKPDRSIFAIEATPQRPAISHLIGARGGGHLREALRECLPEELQAASPLYLILDDISGTSLISHWAWSHWTSDWLDQFKEQREEHLKKMENVCIGFRSGSQALDASRFDRIKAIEDASATDLHHPEDPASWHSLTDQSQAAGMRRARRIDIWREDNIHIDSAFQDSASTPDGSRRALHEYRLKATIDPETFIIIDIEAIPQVLPFNECTAAPAQLSALMGTTLHSMRQQVLDTLPGNRGCTHLNDALRALAEVPKLLEHLNSTTS